MSIDGEITKINEGIEKVHVALYKFNSQLDTILQNLNVKLTGFDNGFPNEAIYYTILVMLLVVLNLCCLYMIYYIYQWIVEREIRFDKEVRRYRKKVYRMVEDRSRTTHGLEHIETPPPTYDEYVRATDLYAKFHSNGVYTSALASPNEI
ncbi:unnamed protein product [Nippostrongylus brasiliensis]|uniref:Protein tweety homolog n=1 Tax=Nippostrongylus brasiliensis TaxID=27835 RepID=A0A0N4Y4G7_NIPBR|nr:unnamed protein product [Nippostrongylus brasiliensis]